jgi:steroid delta-isomerase-like uncharacterized protein
MDTVELRSMVRRFFELPVADSLKEVDRLMSPDFVYHTVGGDLDRATYTAVNAAVLAAFPDVHYLIEDMVAEGNQVVTRWTMEATFTGEYNGIPPTHEKVTLAGVSIDRFAGDQIAETWQFYDAYGFLRQLGALS